MHNRRWAAVAGLITTALAVSACGTSASSDGAGSGFGYGYSTPSATQSSMTSVSTTAKTMQLRTESTSDGTVLASSSGLTLYYYDADKQNSGASACTGSCATAWPPLAGPVAVPAGVTLPGPIGTITRSNGTRQVTVNGYPVYTYSGDSASGQATGNDIGGEWHVVTVSASMGSTGKSSGKDGLLEVKTTSAGTVLANPHGMTVYYYTADQPGSDVSACTGSCAAEWPPVIYPVRVPAGVKLPGPIGFIVRPGGARQVTINGRPIYRYAGDKAPGEANGNGLGNAWYVIKISSASTSTTTTTTTSGSGGGGW
jgi:predicted lipoprotein with Yx(FWY)xxD motif